MSTAEDVLPAEARSGSFADLYRAELDGQVRRAALLLGSSDAANDVVHDAFVEVYRRWAEIDRPGAYLNRAVLNRCRDVGRRRGRADRVRALTAVDAAAASAEHESLADVLDMLPFNQRAAVVLRFYAGLSNVEIARALDCAPGSVGPWLTRALEQLRKALS